MTESKLPKEVRERLLQHLRESAKPYDLETLVRDGVLARRAGNWYRILDAERLPPVVLKHADQVRQDKDGTSLHIPKNAAAHAAELYRGLTGEDPK